MSDSVAARAAEQKVQIRWPFQTGQDARFAHVVAVTTTPVGYLLEFGIFLPSGLAGVEPAEAQRLLSQTLLQVNVVGRILVPQSSALDLREYLTQRLVADGVLKADGTKVGA